MAAYGLTEPGAGSDVAGISTTAVRKGDEYILNGSKTWITNAPVANFFCVFTKTDPQAGHEGMSVFVVERAMPGVTVSKPIPKMGQHASWTGEIVFEDVHVPGENMLGNEGQGFIIAMKVFDRSRPPVAAAAVGVARRAMEEATKYAKERKAFGKPIIVNQGVSFMLADMAMSIEAARLLTHKAAWLVDCGESNTMNSAFAKAFAADTCNEGDHRCSPGLWRLWLQPRISGRETDAGCQDLPALRGHEPDPAGHYRTRIGTVGSRHRGIKPTNGADTDTPGSECEPGSLITGSIRNVCLARRRRSGSVAAPGRFQQARHAHAIQPI